MPLVWSLSSNQYGFKHLSSVFGARFISYTHPSLTNTYFYADHHHFHDHALVLAQNQDIDVDIEANREIGHGAEIIEIEEIKEIEETETDIMTNRIIVAVKIIAKSMVLSTKRITQRMAHRTY